MGPVTASTGMDPPSLDAVERTVSAAFPDATVRDCAELPARTNAVYRVTIEDGSRRRLVVKVRTNAPDRHLVEPAVLSWAAAETPIPVPGVHATLEADDPDNPLDDPVHVLEYVPGEDFTAAHDELPGETLRTVCETAGRHLGRIHRRTFDGVGSLLREDGDLAAPAPRSEWSSLYRRVIEAQVDELARTRFAGVAETARSVVDDAAAGLEATDPRLLHLDYRLGNLRIDPGAEHPVRAVLDWEGASAGPPAYERAHAETLLCGSPALGESTRRDLRSAFRDGYAGTGPQRPGEPPAAYQLVALLRVLKHLDVLVDDRSEGTADRWATDCERRVRGVLDEL